MSPGCIVGVVVLLIAVVVGINFVPAMMDVYSFQDEIVRISEKAGAIKRRHGKNTAKEIQRRLAEKANELGLPIGVDEIEVKISKKIVEIHVVYDLEVNLIVYTYVWHKEHHEERWVVSI
jgi:hypothetical protein